MISVVIPTRWIQPFDKLNKLLDSLSAQHLPVQEILIIIDFDVSKTPLQKAFPHETYSLVTIHCQDGYGVSSARNRWVKKSLWEYILLCDDDIILSDPFTTERLLDEYLDKKDLSSDSVIYPTILWHDTSHIQTQWFIGYNWLLCRPVPKYAIERKSKLRQWWYQLCQRMIDIFGVKWVANRIVCTGAICLFTSKRLLLDQPFDKRFTFIYEDIERSYRISSKGIIISNSEYITIQHRERPKDILAQSYINHPDIVYLKTKHRIRFVLIHANRRQKILFYSCGFRLSNIRTLYFIVYFGWKWYLHPRKRRYNLISARWKGIRDWLVYHE